jgi:signal transduction histidine kinase
MVEAAACEQRRIGQELHDGLGQELAAAAFMVRTLERKLAGKAPEEALEAARIGGMIERTVAHTRDMAGILNPVGPGRDGLMAALANLAAGMSNVYGITCVFEPEAAVPIEDANVATHLFRITQEAVNNAVRHGRPGRIEVGLSMDGDACTLRVADDGRGLPEDWEEAPGMGLKAMRQRARMIGGNLFVENRPGGGTLVRCSFSRVRNRR